MGQLRFGILGTGNIARQFAEGVAGAQRAQVVAVASRSKKAATTFAQRYGVEQACASYGELLTLSGVDAVYVALPNSMHHDWTLRCLAARKHVLCEKPIASTAAEAEAMFEAAEHAGLVLMEAFMYRCHPQTHAIVERVRGGAVGHVKLIRTAFCFRVRQTAGNIRFDAALAGGALLDVGCYCVSFARLIAGAEPTTVHAVGRLHPSGVDEYAAGVMAFPGGVMAEFCCGLSVQTSNAAYICGDEGYIEIPWPWKPTAEATWSINAQVPPRQDGAAAQRRPRETLTTQAAMPLYALEADAFAAAVLDGAPLPVTRDDSVGNMRVLDELRRHVCGAAEN